MDTINLEKLEEFLQDPAVIEKYLSGEMGNNEQLIYRTRAVTVPYGYLGSDPN